MKSPDAKWNENNENSKVGTERIIPTTKKWKIEARNHMLDSRV